MNRLFRWELAGSVESVVELSSVAVNSNDLKKETIRLIRMNEWSSSGWLASMHGVYCYNIYLGWPYITVTLLRSWSVDNASVWNTLACFSIFTWITETCLSVLLATRLMNALLQMVCDWGLSWLIQSTSGFMLDKTTSYVFFSSSCEEESMTVCAYQL